MSEASKQGTTVTSPWQKELLDTLMEVGRWPLHIWLVILAAIALYMPVFLDVIPFQIQSGIYSYGVLIPPIAIGLLYLQKDRLRAARPAPDPVGFFWIALGVLMEWVGWFLRVRFLMMLSLTPVVAGCILALHGRELWRAARFPVLVLLLAAPVPMPIINPPDVWIQHLSAIGSAGIMQTLGFPLIRQGNTIQIPGMTLDVAEACSGFKKLLAFFCFAVLYGWFFALPRRRWLLLTLLALPVALTANVVRIAGLIFIGTEFGEHAFHIAHEYADFFVIALSCVLFLTVGKYMGCDRSRFALEKAQERPAEAEVALHGG
jgi:exosortase